MNGGDSSPVAVFINHYATGPSGITTYVTQLAAHLPELYRINLHAACDEVRSGPASIDVPPERSHDPLDLAERLLAVTRQVPTRRVAWMPNVGDVSWAAAWHALNQLSRTDRARVRVLGIVHGDQESQYAAMRRYAPIIAGVAGVSAQCVRMLNACLPASLRPADLLSYPVTVPTERSAPGWQDPLRLLYAGRFEETQKRVSRLPALFQTLADQGVSFTASVAGAGPAGGALDAQLGALAPDLRTRVRVLGAVPPSGMPTVLCQHDVLLLVSAFEGTPLVVLEAMAAGLCPVVMDLPGGLPELLDDGRNACVVPQGDIGAMARSIRDLQVVPGRLARLKAAARDTIVARADPATHADWLRRRLTALWERPAPAPEAVADPDPLGRRIDRLVATIRARRPTSLAVWGAGVVGRQIIDRFLSAGIAPALMVDADTARQGMYRGVRVLPPDSLHAEMPPVVCVGSIAFADEIVAALRQHPHPPEVLVP